jgi:hypothetical protein
MSDEINTEVEVVGSQVGENEWGGHLWPVESKIKPCGFDWVWAAKIQVQGAPGVCGEGPMLMRRWWRVRFECAGGGRQLALQN